MPYPQISGEPNFILIGISAVFGLFVIIIVYYIVISKGSNADKLYKSNINSSSSRGAIQQNSISGPSGASIPGSSSGSNSYYANALSASSQGQPHGQQGQQGQQGQKDMPTQLSSTTKQVFNIKENIYALDDAAGVCGALGAEPATIEQLIEAHKQGADWCNVGWTKDGLAAFPIQYSTWKTLQDNEPSKRNICGNPGINLVRNDPNLLYGVNCYGIKPEPKQGEKIKNVIQSDAQLALQAKIAEFQKRINNIGVAAFNEDKWSL